MDPLGNEASKLLKTKKLALQTTSLGEIYQNALLALENCATRRNLFAPLKKWERKLA